MFGTKILDDLIQESDVAELDDRLIVLFAAAELLARQKSNDAKIKLSQAERRLMMLRKNSQADSKTIQVGLGGRSPKSSQSGRTTIVVS
jgi:hypothetical protein